VLASDSCDSVHGTLEGVVVPAFFGLGRSLYDEAAQLPMLLHSSPLLGLGPSKALVLLMSGCRNSSESAFLLRSQVIGGHSYLLLEAWFLHHKVPLCLHIELQVMLSELVAQN